MKNDKFERALRLEEREKVRKRNLTDYFLDFSKYHRTWLQELADKYKAKGEFPMFPMVILPSYYKDSLDKEIAVFAALLINENGEFWRVQAFREMLGDNPWEWFQNREFVKLSLGSVLDKRTGGVENWKIARLFDRLWHHCHICNAEIEFVRPIGVEVELIEKAQMCSYFDVLTSMVEDCCVGQYFYKLRLLLMVLGTSGGFGLDIWKIPNNELLSPHAFGIRDFIKTWFPDYRRIGHVDDAVRLFGFERDCDFLYAFLAYKELQKTNPRVCGEYATTYLRWYDAGIKKAEYLWKGILPKIPF